MNAPAGQDIKHIPDWLRRLRDNSWEAEILISGGAIFSLFQLVDWLIVSADHLKEVMLFHGFNEVYLIFTAILRGVTIGFILHLFLRAFWIALVCLDKVYPDGINFDKLPIRHAYRESSEKINLKVQIERLDNLGRIVFFCSFLLIPLLSGFLIVFLIISYIAAIIPASESLFQILTVVFLLDLFLNGILRRNKIIGNIYYPIYWFFNVFSLGVIWRPYVQILFTNVNRFLAGTGLVLFFLASMVFALFSLSSSLHIDNPLDSRSYPVQVPVMAIADDQYLDRISQDQPVRWACIQSDRITDDFIRVFIPYRARYVTAIEDHHEESFDKIVTLAINGRVIRDLQMFTYVRKPILQIGLLTYIPIGDLPKGKNLLTVKITETTFYLDRDELVIPFWKE